MHLPGLIGRARTALTQRDLREDGASAVIVALAMTVIVAAMAITLNYATHVNSKIGLQNAVDEAAVAAATVCQEIQPASSRTSDCGYAQAAYVVHTVAPGATVTSELVTGTVDTDPVYVKVTATIDDPNVLQSSEAGIGSTTKVVASSTASARTIPNHYGPAGLASTMRSVDTGMGISVDGNLYVWGYLYSAAGVPISGGTQKPPQRVPLPEGTVIQASGQIYDVNALDEFGNVWGWGTYNFRNGTDAVRPNNEPQRLRVNSTWNGGGELLSGIESIATSEQAGAGIDSTGHVWTWGTRTYGGTSGDGASLQSGLPDPAIYGNRPVWLKGTYNSFFVVLQNGDVYYKGGNSSCPPGTVSSYDSWAKMDVLAPWTKRGVTGSAPYIMRVDGGINMGGALMSDGTLLTWSYANTASRTGRNAGGIAIVPGVSGVKSMQYGFTGVAWLTWNSQLWGFGASDDYGRFPQTPTLIDTQVAQYQAGQGYYLWEKADGNFWGRGYNPQGAIGLPTGQINSNRQVLYGGQNVLSIISRTG